MKRTTRLAFCKDRNDVYGLMPEQCQHADNPFDPFWASSSGIFHDVFEHWFENRHKYFMKHYAMLLSGELAAHGAMYYYTIDAKVNRLSSGERILTDVGIMQTIEGQMYEAIKYGYNGYGAELLSCIPDQKPIDTHFEDFIDKFLKEISSINIQAELDKDEKEHARTFKKSVKKKTIRNLMRWGYRMGESIAPNSYANANVLDNFIDLFREFTDRQDPQELSFEYAAIVFNIYGGKNLKWHCYFEPHESSDKHYLTRFIKQRKIIYT